MADVVSTLRGWSATPGSNLPAGTTTIGTGLDDNIREIQAVIRKYLASAASNMASATTVDLSTADGYYINITGNTTITGFGTESAGISYLLKFAAALTLTHNATSLILPSAGNIVTAAGDLALFISEGSGNWRCVYFSGTSTKLRVGDSGLFGYTNNSLAQIYRSVSAPTSIQHTLRVVTASQGDNTTYIGTTNAYFEARDITGITAGQRGVLYALHCSVVPSHPRNNVPYDDVAAITFSNTTGTVGANGTDAIYGSANSTAFGDRLTGTAEWYSIFTADCNATVGIVLGGRITTFGLDLNGANIDTGSAIRIANSNYIVARNAGDSANLNLIGLNSDNTVVLGGANVSGVRVLSSYFGVTVPVVSAAATYTVLNSDNYLIFNGSGCTVTLPVAGSFPGRVLHIKTTTGFAVISASSNVVPLAGGSAGTAIVAATAGKWATLVSDSANWQIVEGNA